MAIAKQSGAKVDARAQDTDPVRVKLSGTRESIDMARRIIRSLVQKAYSESGPEAAASHRAKMRGTVPMAQHVTGFLMPTLVFEMLQCW